MTRNIPKDLEDCYEVLGLKPGASECEIKQAFRRASKDGVHPDTGGTAAQFRVVKGCYEKLLNYLAQHATQNGTSHPYSGNATARNQQSLEFQIDLGRGTSVMKPIPLLWYCTPSRDGGYTSLEGVWEVVGHQDTHTWISVTSNHFIFANKGGVERWVKIETKRLCRLAVYERQLVLYTNADSPDPYTCINVKVVTSDLPFRKEGMLVLPYFSLGILLLWSGFWVYLGDRDVLSDQTFYLFANFLMACILAIGSTLASGILGALIGGLSAGFPEALHTAKEWVLDGFKIAIKFVLFSPLLSLTFCYFQASLVVILPFIVVFSNLRRRGFAPFPAASLLLLVGEVGAGLTVGTPTAVFTLVVVGLPLALLLLLPVLENRRLLARYKKSEKSLIQP
jgi:hypothetical protein